MAWHVVLGEQYFLPYFNGQSNQTACGKPVPSNYFFLEAYEDEEKCSHCYDYIATLYRDSFWTSEFFHLLLSETAPKFGFDIGPPANPKRTLKEWRRHYQSWYEPEALVHQEEAWKQEPLINILEQQLNPEKPLPLRSPCCLGPVQHPSTKLVFARITDKQIEVAAELPSDQAIIDHIAVETFRQLPVQCKTCKQDLKASQTRTIAVLRLH